MTLSDDDRFSGASAQHVEIDNGKVNKNVSVRTAPFPLLRCGAHRRPSIGHSRAQETIALGHWPFRLHCCEGNLKAAVAFVRSLKGAQEPVPRGLCKLELRLAAVLVTAGERRRSLCLTVPQQYR